MENSDIRVLIISAVPWNRSTNFGNSYSDIFDGIDGIEIVDIYLSKGTVDDSRVSRAFEISEDMLIRNIRNPKYIVGNETYIEETTGGEKIERESIVQKIKKYGMNHKLSIFYFCRDALWKVGRWKSSNMIKFINDFDPNIIFAPVNGSTYPNNIILDISKSFNLPIIGYISDDNYTFQHFNLSPLYWIRRLFIRESVGRLIKRCDILYVISKKQKDLYDSIFNINTKVLTKGFQDRRDSVTGKKDKSIIEIVYTGNLGLNRWKSIAVIANEIKRINSNEVRIRLMIYSGTILTNAMRKSLTGRGVQFKGSVDSSQIHDIQRNADILLHVEATDFAHKWDAMYGFSTKLVDYFSEGKPILAYGNIDQASICYLKENDAAFVATNEEETRRILKEIIINRNLLEEYAEKSFVCGKRNHNKEMFQQMILHDIRKTVLKNKTT